VIDAFCAGLEDRLARKLPIDTLASVASCFVSRIDTEADKRIGAALGATSEPPKRAALEGLVGKTAIANSKRLYRIYLQSLQTGRFKKLAEAGARRQRPLWASTSTKNPKYPDTYYVDALIGPDTVDTMPFVTIDAFRDHGTLARTLDEGMEAAETDLAALEGAGISLKDITDTLLIQGIELFEKSFSDLHEVVRKKIDAMRSVVVNPAR
jgi:transaldolase